VNTIDRFNSPYRFLSNFWPARVYLDGVDYATVEHAYQAAKTILPSERKTVRECVKPGEAKRCGRRVTIRADWEEVKLDVMYELLRQKFSEPRLREQLLATGNAQLVEGNYWGDIFWGVCNGVGQNNLGKLLMKVRSEL
jgi:N-glycosidase YbiA